MEGGEKERVKFGFDFKTPLMNNFIQDNYLTKPVNISEENR